MIYWTPETVLEGSTHSVEEQSGPEGPDLAAAGSDDDECCIKAYSCSCRYRQ